MAKKTVPASRLFPTRNDLPAGTRGRLVDVLNARLADLIDLQVQFVEAHQP